MKRNAPLATLAKITPVDVAGLVVLTAMALAFVFGLLGPLAERGQRAAAQAESGVRQQQRINGTIASIRALKAEIEQTKTAITASPLRILPQTALNARVAALVALSAECGLVVDELKPGAAVRGTRFVAVSVEMTGHGSYRDSARFLRLLHERFSDVGVCGFRLSGAPEQPGSACSVVFDLQWLALPQDAAAQVVAVPTQ